jgi:hypothetical protein
MVDSTIPGATPANTPFINTNLDGPSAVLLSKSIDKLNCWLELCARPGWSAAKIKTTNVVMVKLIRIQLLQFRKPWYIASKT